MLGNLCESAGRVGHAREQFGGTVSDFRAGSEAAEDFRQSERVGFRGVCSVANDRPDLVDPTADFFDSLCDLEQGRGQLTVYFCASIAASSVARRAISAASPPTGFIMADVPERMDALDMSSPVAVPPAVEVRSVTNPVRSC